MNAARNSPLHCLESFSLVGRKCTQNSTCLVRNSVFFFVFFSLISVFYFVSYFYFCQFSILSARNCVLDPTSARFPPCNAVLQFCAGIKLSHSQFLSLHQRTYNSIVSVRKCGPDVSRGICHCDVRRRRRRRRMSISIRAIRGL